jgi:mutator protein MutT
MKDAVVVAIALVWDGQRLLVTQRPAGTHLAGRWEFPGGKVEASETPEACAEREVLEEVGLSVEARSRLTPIRHAYAERDVTLHPIECNLLGGELRLLGVSDARWVLPHELTTLTFPEANRPLIAELVARAESSNRSRGR